MDISSILDTYQAAAAVEEAARVQLDAARHAASEYRYHGQFAQLPWVLGPLVLGLILGGVLHRIRTIPTNVARGVMVASAIVTVTVIPLALMFAGFQHAQNRTNILRAEESLTATQTGYLTTAQEDIADEVEERYDVVIPEEKVGEELTAEDNEKTEFTADHDGKKETFGFRIDQKEKTATVYQGNEELGKGK